MPILELKPMLGQNIIPEKVHYIIDKTVPR